MSQNTSGCSSTSSSLKIEKFSPKFHNFQKANATKPNNSGDSSLKNNSQKNKTNHNSNQQKMRNPWKSRQKNPYFGNNPSLRENLSASRMQINCNPFFNYGSWFWNNYRLAKKWQEAHVLNSLKASLACDKFQETFYNFNYQSRSENYSNPKRGKQHRSSKSWKTLENIDLMQSLSNLETETSDQEEESEYCSEDKEFAFEFKVDENMVNFLEQSLKHKQEMQKLRESEYDSARVDAEMYEAPEESAAEQRRKTMEFLYGDAAPRILSMEMALQLSFDRHFDQKQPPFWPNIPLIL